MWGCISADALPVCTGEPTHVLGTPGLPPDGDGFPPQPQGRISLVSASCDRTSFFSKQAMPHCCFGPLDWKKITLAILFPAWKAKPSGLLWLLFLIFFADLQRVLKQECVLHKGVQPSLRHGWRDVWQQVCLLQGRAVSGGGGIQTHTGMVHFQPHTAAPLTQSNPWP